MHYEFIMGMLSGSVSPWYDTTLDCRCRRQVIRDGPPALGLGRGLTPYYKILACYEMLHRAFDFNQLGGALVILVLNLWVP
jgi:hypothetical protein